MHRKEGIPKILGDVMLMCKRSRIRGFSLLEIIVATSLLALIVLGLGALFLTSKRMSKYTILSITAAEVSKFYLNALYRDVRQDRIQGGASDNCFVNSPGGCENAVYVEPNFNKTITPIFNVPSPQPFPGSYKVRLELQWTEN